MAEFTNPNLESGASWVVLVLIVALVWAVFGLRRLSATSGAGAASPHAQQVRVEAAQGATPVASGSMNLIERQLFAALAVVQAHVVKSKSGSWGWAIVLLTTAINLLLLPLRIASLRSGVKMQRIQPQIAAIKARYKNVALTDPLHNEMSAEIAHVQKNNDVNPFGGCVPTLIQMPLLLAFFGMLRKAVVLRGAPWLWLHDLSSADPYHVLPILMVVFQIVVQLYTPSPGIDARQRKLMACVTAVGFGYVSWHYAAGLALYALTGSLLAIATQAVVNISPLGREMRTLRA